MNERARTVRISVPADLSDWGRSIVADDPFQAYLGRVRREAREGDLWEEFVGVGCCGDTLDVPLRVEAVEGGTRVDEDTEFVLETREACGIAGGWSVQSASDGGGTESGSEDGRET